MLGDPPKIVAVASRYVVAEWRGHTLVIWQHEPTLEAAREVARTVERLAELHPGRTALLAIVRPLSSLPDEATRRVYIDVGRKVSETLSCAALLIESEGFSGAALRAVTTGIGIAAGVRFPLRSFATLGELAAWVRPRLAAGGAQAVPEEELREAFAIAAAAMPPL